MKVDDKILLEWPVTVHPVVRSSKLRSFCERFPFITKLLTRLPNGTLNKVFRDQYSVTERSFERAFLFMNIGDLPLKSRILDVGCAWSSLSLEMASVGFKVWGIDISPYPLFHPNLTTVQGTICRTSFKDAFFDVVVAISSIEHIGLGWYGETTESDSDMAAMLEIQRILKNNGRVILTIPYGRKQCTPVFRVYDKDQLKSLTKGFTIIREIYSINHQDKYWYLSDESTASKQGVNERSRNKGNVCLVLGKP